MQSFHHHTGHDHHDLIQKIISCALACEQCAAACLDESDVTMLARCIELDRDCSDICFQAAKFLQRDSEIAHKFLIICEDMCKLCADECSKHNNDHCKKCFEACRLCAQACYEHRGTVQLN